MSVWSELEHELDAWRAAGRDATMWWRDDDAVAPTPALDRLLSIAAQAARGAVPIALAVIPVPAEPGLADRLARTPTASVLQHGYAHLNHAETGSKKAELGCDRPVALSTSELLSGCRRLQALFGKHAGRPVLPVLVPPWNRIDGAVLHALPGLGFFGISMHRARLALEPCPGLRMVNAHVDIVDWRNGKAFLGAEPALGLLIEHLSARRRGMADADEPTGLLTHHLVHAPDAWDFVAELLERTTAHAATRWVDVRRAFGAAEPAPAAASA